MILHHPAVWIIRIGVEGYLPRRAAFRLTRSVCLETKKWFASFPKKLEEFRGKDIALIGKRVVASGDNAMDVLEKAKEVFPERGEPRKKWEDRETDKRHEPVWIVAGDFNFTQESEEYETIRRMNFIDVVPNKGGGTKAKGADKSPTLTVDYIFAGPKFISLDPLITTDGIKNNTVDHTVIGSDHYPMYAKIPIAIPEE